MNGTQAVAEQVSYEAFTATPEDGLRHELIDGVHYVTPSPSPRHQTIVLNLGRLLAAHIQERHLGKLFVAPCEVVLLHGGNQPSVQPDLFFIAAARTAMIQTTKVVGVPDLMIEVLSESTRRHDEITKRRLYERAGVREYWLLDPEVESLRVYRLIDGSYQLTNEAILAQHTAIHLEGILGSLPLPLSSVFAD